MRILHKITGALAALTTALHIFVGGADSLAPMLDAGLPNSAEGAMHGCWHMVSILLAWSTVVFWRGRSPALHFGLLWCACAAVFVYVGLHQDVPDGLTTNPQWTLLGLVGGLAILGQRQASTPNAE